MEIQFDLGGDPSGGRINNYLLEKSRVVYQTPGERNFHIFYQLLSCGDSALASELGLTTPDYFNYLNQGACYTVDGTDDRADWTDTVNAMKVMGFSGQEQSEIFKLLAAILYLGNVSFKPDNKDQASIVDTQVVDMFAYLIQSDTASCSKALIARTISTGTQGKSARVSTYAVPQNVEGAVYSRDALAKALYSRLFDFIIGRVNSALGWMNDDDCLVLGILDIYGFVSQIKVVILTVFLGNL
jgi:myosin-1